MYKDYKIKAVYIANSISQATAYIRANTDWYPVKLGQFANGDELITIVTNIDKMRGVKWDKAYTDYYHFGLLSDEQEYWISKRLMELGLVPVALQELQV